MRLGFAVSGLGLGVLAFRFGVLAFGFGVSGCTFEAWGLGFGFVFGAGCFGGKSPSLGSSSSTI